VRASTRRWQRPPRAPVRSIQAVPRPRLLILAVVILLGAAAPADAATTVRQASGATPAAIQTVVNQFRADLGPDNGTNGAEQSGRREIDWDDVTDDKADPNMLPPAYFDSRGVLLSTPGTGLQVSADASNPDSEPPEFGHPSLFAPFSPPRLFSPLGSTVTIVDFVDPDTGQPALSRGFGAVFTNVDTSGRSKIELFGADGQTLAVRNAPPATGNQTLSFVGVAFDEGRVARVRITSGDHAPDSGITTNDTTVLDDFIFGEPIPDGPDGDGIGQFDNCPTVANPDQANLDGDADGDACDEDIDDDGAPNDLDAFPFDPTEKLDTDHDGVGDNVDRDDDNDGWSDTFERRRGTDPKNPDTDGDGLPDPADNCPLTPNPEQADANGDGRGDVCADVLAPKLSTLRLRPSRFQRGPKNGTKISFRLSEAATVRLSVSRAKGTIVRHATAGVNFVKFEGRIGGHVLRSGRHTLVASAIDLAGNRGVGSVRAKFRIMP
jgi:hypothetical protein